MADTEAIQKCWARVEKQTCVSACVGQSGKGEVPWETRGTISRGLRSSISKQGQGQAHSIDVIESVITC